MHLALLSDTHANIKRTLTSIDIFLEHNIETVIHCGDIGSEEVLIELAAAFRPKNVPVYAVMGNVDPWSNVSNFPKDVGITLRDFFGELPLGDKTAAIVHGHDPHVMNHALQNEKLDYIFTGHTHIARDETNQGLRIINPGALHRSASPSIAILDTNTDNLSFISLP